MDEPDRIATPAGLNLNIQSIEDTPQLPLAAARNRGIGATQTDNVIFIDVDCIVSPTLFANLLAGLQADKIIAAYPLYLPAVPEIVNYAALKRQAVSHPAREHIPAGQAVEHLKFWSLIFAIQKQTFKKIGGFDESFLGYGAEDTDFAMMFDRVGVKQIFVRDYILHQYHNKHDPPLNYFESIIKNAIRYQQKWGVLPMMRWLKAFEKMGLIKIDEAENITVFQKPTDDQIKNSLSLYPY
ncbi:hypothetical protein A0256_14580 [Mucilaginibacter sp. PAMC 26640]|nr:hypothetical protein A0256_14580 [Mucilaginibacter sp. PAMC 26640]